MSFWNLSNGDSATENATKEFDGGGGNMEPMPEGTAVLAMAEQAAWQEDRSNNEFLSIRWTVLKPSVFRGRKVFQKIWCSDPDPRAKDPDKKRDKAVNMLSAIDANAGGKLMRKAGKPSNDELALALTNKQMWLRLGLWEMEGDDGKPMSGNYVQAVGPKDREVPEVDRPASRAVAQRQTVQTRQGTTPLGDYDDSDVPF